MLDYRMPAAYDRDVSEILALRRKSVSPLASSTSAGHRVGSDWPRPPLDQIATRFAPQGRHRNAELLICPTKPPRTTTDCHAIPSRRSCGAAGDLAGHDREKRKGEINLPLTCAV